MDNTVYMPEGVDPAMEEILARAYKDTAYFCKMFMPRTFTKPFSNIHREVFAALDDDSIQKLVIAMPRGWGKTSIINKAYPAKKILFRDRQYIIPISATAPSAIEFSENLKSELTTNSDIMEVFGPIHSKTVVDDSAGPFSTLEWVTDSGIKVLPRGAGQQVRGRLYRDARPDLFIIDDIEDDEGVESEDRRRKLMKWFLSALKNSVEFNANWRIIVVGTILHEDGLLANLLNPELFPDWTQLRYELCDDEYHSNWPEHMSDAQCRALRDEFKAAGQLDVFFREYRNLSVPTDDKPFGDKHLYYEESEEELNKDPYEITAILTDPAKTMSTGAAKTAIVAVSVNTVKNRWCVRDVVFKNMKPDETYDEMFAMAQRTNALILAPLVTSLNEYIIQPIQNEMHKRGEHYILVQVKERQPKTGPKRSAGLIPLYRQGAIFHNRRACAVLEDHLALWPRPPKWDIIDALAGMLFVLEEGEQYFMPPGGEDIEAEYAELENQPAINLPLIV